MQHINAVMNYFNSLRDKHAPYFHNNRFPKASFCNTNVFSELLKSYSSFKKGHTKKTFLDSVNEVARGDAYPKMNWKKDVDIIYGVTKLGKHWIGFTINVKNKTIESFACNHPQENKLKNLETVSKIAGNKKYLKSLTLLNL